MLTLDISESLYIYMIYSSIAVSTCKELLYTAIARLAYIICFYRYFMQYRLLDHTLQELSNYIIKYLSIPCIISHDRSAKQLISIYITYQT